MATGPVIRTVTKIVIGPKRATAIVLQNGPVGIPHYAETTEVIAPVMANTRDHVGRRVHPTATKASRDAEEAPVLHTTVRGHALPRVNLCRLHLCSIPLLYRHCAGCLPDLPEPSSAHLSFNQSRSSLPPLDLGGGDAHPIYVCGHTYPGGHPIHCRSIITIRIHCLL